MDRTFERSTQRRRRTLDGQWEFLIDPEDAGVDEGYHESFPSEEADRVAVPCSWNAYSEYAAYVGPAWYRRTFALPESTAVALTFHGVGHDATVYLDGEELVSHSGGYTPFSTYVRDLESGEHELVVRADSGVDETALPHGGTGFSQGGIYREVVLEELSGVWVSELDVEYELAGETAALAASVTLHNVDPTPSERTVAFSVGDASATESVEVRGLDVELVDFEVTVGGVDRWSPDDPVLYDAVAAVSGGDGDDVRERVGFREVETDGRDVLVNGDPVDLVGVDYPDTHPDWGHGVPLRVQQGDVRALAEAGATLVRCGDYPPHPRFLDLCDEAGLLVVEGISPGESVDTLGVETDAAPSEGEVGSAREGLGEARAADQENHDRRSGGSPVSDAEDPTGEARRVLTEIVDRDGTHPSVVGWSIGDEHRGNRGDLTETLSQLRGTLRGLDGSRLVVAGSDAPATGQGTDVFDYSDVVCIDGLGVGDDWDAVLDTALEDHGEKPVVVTGVGDEGVPGERSLAGRRGSEGNQAETVRTALQTARDREGVAGVTIRQFCDTLSGGDTESLAHGTEYTGLLTGDRTPKEAFRVFESELDR